MGIDTNYRLLKGNADYQVAVLRPTPGRMTNCSKVSAIVLPINVQGPADPGHVCCPLLVNEYSFVTIQLHSIFAHFGLLE